MEHVDGTGGIFFRATNADELSRGYAEHRRVGATAGSYDGPVWNQEPGPTVEVDDQTSPNGRFAQPEDPEGNPVQLWEPA